MDEWVVEGQELQIVQSSLMGTFAEFLRLNVANVDASMDTIRGYQTQVTQGRLKTSNGSSSRR